MHRRSTKTPACCVFFTLRHSTYPKYASWLRISETLHPDIFEQPALSDFFINL